MSGGGTEREGDTESEADSRLRAVGTEPDVGLELTNREIMTGAEVGSSTDQATQAPHDRSFQYPSVCPPQTDPVRQEFLIPSCQSL